jgi:hypothetical protein
MDRDLIAKHTDELLALAPQLDPRRLVISYDHDSDTLMVYLFGRDIPGVSIQMADGWMLRLNRETGELVGIQIEYLLASAARTQPQLLRVLEATNCEAPPQTRSTGCRGRSRRHLPRTRCNWSSIRSPLWRRQRVDHRDSDGDRFSPHDDGSRILANTWQTADVGTMRILDTVDGRVRGDLECLRATIPPRSTSIRAA